MARDYFWDIFLYIVTALVIASMLARPAMAKKLPSWVLILIALGFAGVVTADAVLILRAESVGALLGRPMEFLSLGVILGSLIAEIGHRWAAKG